MNTTTAKKMITTHHMRHIFMPVDQTIRKFIPHNNLLKVTIQSHPMKDGCYKSNEKCLIVATINPIWHSCPVHHGTFFNVLIDKFIVCQHCCTALSSGIITAPLLFEQEDE